VPCPDDFAPKGTTVEGRFHDSSERIEQGEDGRTYEKEDDSLKAVMARECLSGRFAVPEKRRECLL